MIKIRIKLLVSLALVSLFFLAACKNTIQEDEEITFVDDELQTAEDTSVAAEKTSSTGLCQPFASSGDEVLCEDAVNTALKRFPGEVYSVDKTTMTSPLEGQDSEEKFWVVGVSLDTPIEEMSAGVSVDKVEIFISVNTGTISVLRPS